MTSQRILCAHCHQVIGAYEPLVVRHNGADRVTSIAAEPGLPVAGAEHLHADCADETAPQAEVVRINPVVTEAADGAQSAAGRGNRDRRVG